MKPVFLLTFFISLLYGAFAQPVNMHNSYSRALYTITASSHKPSAGYLYFYAKETVWVDTASLGVGNEEVVQKLGPTNEERYVNYRQPNGLWVRTYLQGGKTIVNKMITDKAFIVDEADLPSIKWNLTPINQTVAGRLCTQATCHFRGRMWRVWFDPTIPISAGPWKLNGLPGLIVQAKDSTNKFGFELVSLDKNSTPPALTSYEVKEKPLTGHQAWDLAKKLQEGQIEAMIARLKEQYPGGTFSEITQEEGADIEVTSE